MSYFGISTSVQVPHVQKILLDLTAFIIVEEILFYYSHRLLHHPYFYKRIHKQHHKFKAPIGLAAMYAHWIEFTFSNVLPLLAGPLIMRSHLVTIWIWYFLGVVGTVTHHSGYNFPWLLGLNPQFHDFHHSSFNYNFGVLGVLDQIHGTGAKATQKGD
eukprot:TRINITY_DN5328_c0_g1_i2.p1 TRINITY_DN5328_c0_g1~~TRINITY_DN5328_c0_g1_i2.p1  ORF type:complete len:158 (-),score=5.01 TRINITY_DN5328_c0_g1_i2:51-524(-)